MFYDLYITNLKFLSKMKISNTLNLLFIVVLLLASCKKNETSKKEETSKITIKKLQDSPTYADAVLQLNAPENLTSIAQDTVNFSFQVDNYTLGAQTESPNASKLANSGKGQHIHFILNNQPYSAHYTANFKKNIPNGVHHLVAFLSRKLKICNSVVENSSIILCVERSNISVNLSLFI